MKDAPIAEASRRIAEIKKQKHSAAAAIVERAKREVRQEIAKLQ